MSVQTRLFLFYSLATLVIAYIPGWLLGKTIIDQPDQVLAIGSVINLVIYAILACSSAPKSTGKTSHFSKWISVIVGWLIGAIGFHLIAVALGATLIS